MKDKIFKNKKVDETAAAGSTAGGSIATVPSRMGDMQRRISLKDFMTDFYKRVANRAYFTPVKLESSIKGITESTEHPFQMNDVVSRLKGMESQGRYSTVDSITFGVEDDAKNIMKVTIPKEQAEAFELSVARALADVIEFKKTGVGENRTLAQLLYDLNGQFTIINAEFPKIPSEAVYNADEISRMPDDAIGEQEDQDIDMDDPEGEEQPMDDPEADPEAEGEPEESPEDEEDLDDMDDETVSGFEDEGEESLLRSVLAMLKSQSEKEIAQANAEAEKAKARQAELAHEASMKRLETEEEMLQAEAEMEAEKEKEKEAKRLADLAKFKYTRKATREGFSDTFVKALFEVSDMDSVQSKRMQLRALRQKWQPAADDSPETRRYKQQQLQNAIRVNRLEQQAVRTRDEYEQEKAERERQEQEQERQEQQMQDREAGPEAGAEQGRM